MSAAIAPVLIMAGGTGGHIFPGLAVARALQAQSVPVVWLGSRHGLENRLVPAAGIALETVTVTGVRGRGALSLLLAPLAIARAVWQAVQVLRRHRPRAVLSMGGFAAGPGGVAAWLLRRPLIVHEQNRVPGMTNRALAKLARRVLCGFPGSFPAAAAAETVGNPVRAEIAALPEPAVRLQQRSGPLRLLVLGGSQGARALNIGVPQAIAALGTQAIEIRHQSGEKMLDITRAAYHDAGITVDVEPFIADMAAAYAWADLLVCRAGALTLAEIAAAGIASVLVPYPHAVDDHQTRNAEFLVEAGAARRVPEGEGFAQRLHAALAPLTGDRATLLRMAAAARAQAQPHAADTVAAICIEEARA